MRLNIGREYAQQHNPHRIRKHCAAVKQALELYCWLGEKENGIERHTLKHSPLISNVIVNQMLLNFVILHNKPNDLCVLCVCGVWWRRRRRRQWRYYFIKRNIYNA